MLEQAMKENVAMAQGMDLGPTPLASPDHTMLHNKFLEQNTDESMPEVRDILNKHILGETQFQEQLAGDMSNNMGGIPAGGANAANPNASAGAAV